MLLYRGYLFWDFAKDFILQCYEVISGFKDFRVHIYGAHERIWMGGNNISMLLHLVFSGKHNHFARECKVSQGNEIVL